MSLRSTMGPTAPTILVVRVSEMDGVDPIRELDDVIKQRGFAWFGKYGRPLGAATVNTIGGTLLILSSASTKGATTYKSNSYVIAGFSRGVPTDRVYPKYYQSFLRRIKSWVLVMEAPTQAKVSIGELVVASSHSSLRETLGRSMSAHFICRRAN